MKILGCGKMTRHEEIIDSMIPLAEVRADLAVEKMKVKSEIRNGAQNSKYRHHFHSEIFHREMNRLAKKAGLRCG